MELTRKLLVVTRVKNGVHNPHMITINQVGIITTAEILTRKMVFGVILLLHINAGIGAMFQHVNATLILIKQVPSLIILKRYELF
jgi:hypothetical protein